MRPNRLFPALFIVLLALLPQPARAAMVFCNHTGAALDAALCYRDQDDWVSEGWWRIEPGQCARVFGKPLAQRFYFYYGVSLAPHPDSRPPLTWVGKYEFCTDTKAFHATGDEDCESRNLRTQGFREIDIGTNVRDYTLDFKDDRG